jgi:hypothetical protein
MRRALWMLSCVLAGACSSKGNNTKLMVVVGSDLAVPTEMDNIQVDIQGPSTSSSVPIPLTGGNEKGNTKLPVVLQLVSPDNKRLAFNITANGYLGPDFKVGQTASLSFDPGHTRVLTFFLGRDCQGVGCVPADVTTCSRGRCDQAIAIDVSTLPFYDPKQPFLTPDAGDAPDGLDASTDAQPIPVDPNDAGPDLAAPDGANICLPPMAACLNACVDFDTNTNNCGACGQGCSSNKGIPICTTSRCSMSICAAGYLDCSVDENVSRDGCETHSAEDVNNCGQCGRTCPNDWAHSTAQCLAGSCEQQCTAPWDNCDGDGTNGCEANLDTDESNCGHCKNECSSKVCRKQICLSPENFGASSPGDPTVSAQFSPGYLAGVKVYVPSAGVVTALGAVLADKATSCHMVLGLYRDMAGIPGELVAATEPALVGRGGNTLSVSPPVDVSSGSYWILGVWDDTAWFASDSATLDDWRYATCSFGVLPSPKAPENMQKKNYPRPNIYVTVAK